MLGGMDEEIEAVRGLFWTSLEEDGATATVEDADDVRATLNGWFDITNAEVSEMIDDLITALDRHEYTGDLETGLGITVERI